MRVSATRPATFTLYVRVPAWAGPATALKINGKSFPVSLQPGTFAALQREWKDGDEIEYAMDMPLRLEPVDQPNPDTVALLYGPLALFATSALDVRLTRAQLLGARQFGAGSSDWIVQSSAGRVIFRSFAAIGKEPYRLYHTASA